MKIRYLTAASTLLILPLMGHTALMAFAAVVLTSALVSMVVTSPGNPNAKIDVFCGMIVLQTSAMMFGPDQTIQVWAITTLLIAALASRLRWR